MIEDALSHEACAEAREIYKCALGDAEVDKAKVEVLKCGFANLDVAQGRYEREFELRWGDFVRNQTLSSYVSLKEVAMAMGKTEQVRADAIRKLELAGKWRLLSQIALSECRLADAAKYYLKNSGNRLADDGDTSRISLISSCRIVCLASIRMRP